MKVVVILDPTHGTRDEVIDADAYWIVDSPSNRELVAANQAQRNFDPNSAIVDGGRYTSKAEAALAIFFNVLDHQPAWTEIEFVDTAPSEALIREAMALNLKIRTRPTGFTILPATA